MESVREELKREVSALGRRGRGRPYPKDLIEKLLSYTVARRREGATIVEVGEELGMSFMTLRRWFTERKERSRFRRVEVATPSPLPAKSRLIVHGPRGLRVEGLDLEGVAELLRRVGE